MDTLKRTALAWAAIAAACSGDAPTAPSFVGRFVLAAIDGQPVASVVFRYASNGIRYESTVAGDTIDVLGSSTMRRALWFRTIALGPPKDSVLPPEGAQYCGSFSREGNRVEARLQGRRCTDPEGYQVQIDSFFLDRRGVTTRGMNPANLGAFDAEWLFVRR